MSVIRTMKKLERWTRILSSLDRLEFATIKQIQRLHNLQYKNCYRILKDMKDEGLVQSKRYESLVYYLTKEGRSEIGSENKPELKMLHHTLMRNDLYIALGCPVNWENEKVVKKPVSIIADAYYQKNGKHVFVEIDRTVPMRENRKKLNLYEKINKATDIQLIYYTITEHRRKQLQNYANVPIKVYTIDDLR